jgi:hypothetical protein
MLNVRPFLKRSGKQPRRDSWVRGFNLSIENCIQATHGQAKPSQTLASTSSKQKEISYCEVGKTALTKKKWILLDFLKVNVCL